MCVRHTGGTQWERVAARPRRGCSSRPRPAEGAGADGECDGSEVIPQTWRLTQLSWRIKTNTAAAAVNT